MFDRYVTQARKLQQKYKGQIDLIVGMETEYICTDTVNQIKELRTRYSLDYLVGSIHHVDGMQIDFSEEEYCDAEEKCGGTEAIMIKYYNQQYEMLKEIKPEVIGHFDLISLYRPAFHLTDAVLGKIKRNIDYGISYGALFEVNTAYRPGNPYPRPDILEVC
jgi:histidinol-phosphatase (PHP family)